MFKKLGKFEIKQILGNGAMGEVYLGVDPAIGREVAIKTILPGNAGGPEAKERFAREAMAAGVLNHPNLVTIYEFGEDQGVMYIAMELVRGHDLQDLMKDQALTRTELLEILAQVCDGLDFAHRNHIVHRDIKPSNVRVSRDGAKLHAKVMDFGVARVGNSDMTATGMVMGTVSYMAPEYIRTGRPDPRSDLFAIGVMLYEGFSGRKPFSGDTATTILYKIVNEPPEPIDLSQLQGISPAIKMVLDRALDKDPDVRFQTADDLGKALRAAKDPTWAGQVAVKSQEATVQLAPTLPTGVTVAPAPPPPPRPASQPRPTSKAPLIAVAAILLLLSGGMYGLYRLKGRAATAEPSSTALSSVPASTSQTPAPAVVPPQVPASPVAQAPATNPPGRVEAARAPGLNPRELRAAEPTYSKPAAEPPEFRASGEEEGMRNLSSAERKSQSLTAMSEATALAESDPDKALQGLHRAIALNPSNANAYAWRIVILYRQGRYLECKNVYRRARREGVTGELTRNQAFNRIMLDEKFQKHIPGGLGGDE